MRYPDSRVGGIDALAAWAGRSIDVYFEVFWVDLYFEFVRFREHGHCDGGGVNPSLRFCGGHPLDSMNASFIFEPRVRALAMNQGNDLLEAPRRAERCGHHLDAPPPTLGIPAIGPEQVGCEQRRLFSARARSYFKKRVLLIVGVLGQEQQIEHLLQLFLLGFQARQVLTRQGYQLVILFFLKHRLQFFDLIERIGQGAVGLHDLGKLGLFLRELFELLGVGHDLRPRKLLVQVFVPLIQFF